MQLTNITAQDAAGAQIEGGVPEEQVRRAVFEILQCNVLCAMATVTPAGRAHINTVYFCYSEELELCFLSHPRSVHCRNLVTNPAMGVAIFSSEQQWGVRDAGVQLFGTCGQADGAEANQAEELYGRRFSAYREWKSNRSGALGAEYRFYRFVTDRVKVLDEANLGDGVIVVATLGR